MCPVRNHGSWETVRRILALPFLTTEMLIDGLKAAGKENDAITIGVRAPLALFGCSTYGGNQCWNPNAQPDPAALEGETKYQSGDITVIMPQRVDPGVAQYFLAQLESCKGFVRDTFTLDTPYRKINFIMRRDTPGEPFCGDGAVMCARGGDNTLYFPIKGESIIGVVNDAFKAGAYVYSSACDDKTIAHEMSHLLRHSVANFSAVASTPDAFKHTGKIVEEGLAQYTALKVAEATYERSTLLCERLFDVETGLGFNGFVHFPEPSTVAQIRVKSRDAGGIEIEYCLWSHDAEGNAVVSSGTPAYFSFSEATYLEDAGVFIRATEVDAVHFNLKIYDAHGQSMAYPEVLVDGFRYVTKYKTADGNIIIPETTATPYQAINLDDFNGPYAMGILFWLAVRQQYGEQKISDLLSAITAIHRDDGKRYFSFFDVFVQVMGVERSDARAFFTRFSISPDATYDDLELCWQ
jgi:hypothetical protein